MTSTQLPSMIVTRYIDDETKSPAKRAKFPACRPPKEPQGYLAWHEWAERKSKTHKQVRCREHGLFHNWIRREVTA